MLQISGVGEAVGLGDRPSSLSCFPDVGALDPLTVSDESKPQRGEVSDV
jgi:hypothetical protein